MSSSARTTGRGSRLDQLMNKKARHPWEMGSDGSDEDDDGLAADSGVGLNASSTHSKSSSRRRQLLFGNRASSGRSLLGPAPVISPKPPKTTRTKPASSSSGAATPTAPESLSPKPITPTSPKKKKRDKSSRKEKANRRGSTGNSSDTLRGSKHREQQNDDGGPPELAPYGRSNTDSQIQSTPFSESTTSSSTPGEVEQIKPRPKELSPRPRKTTDNNKHQKRHKRKASKKNKNKGDATSDHELLGIDFEADGDALREALGAEVLAMWDAQGLYMDLPELRPTILQGVVEQKFQALVEEQNALREKVLLTQNGRAKSSSIGIGSLGAPDDDCAMSIIAEGSEEEDEESSDEEEEMPQREEMPTLAEEESLDDSQQSAGKEKKDADPAMNASGVMDELHHRLEEMDTSDHHCVEAEGCLGQVDRDVPISDQHAFNKFKLRDAVEKRVSAIFTEDHKVVVSESFGGETDDSAEKDNDEKNGNEEEILVKEPTTADSHSPKVELRKGLTESFQTFDKLVGVKAPESSADDEWTECSASVAANQVKPLDKDIVQRIASRASGSNIEVDYEEVTVAEQSIFEEVTVQGEELDVDALSKQKAKKSAKEKSNNDSDSYLEYTVKEEEPPKSTFKKKASKTESLSSSLSMVDSLSKNKDQASASESRQSTLDDFGGSFFPTINTTVMDDDDMTQLTFDVTMDGMNSVTQDHHHADAYFKNRGNVTPSPPRKYHSADSQQTDPTRASTSQQLMDDSATSHNNSETSSTDLSSQAAAALAKSVAKVLRVEVWSPNASVAQAAMEKLCQAASIGSYQRSNITRLGGIIAILRCMQMHTPNASIQLAACKALQKLSVDRETQISIGDVGGISAVAASMHNHIDTVELQVSGCKVLSTITSQRSTEETDDADDDDDVPTDGAVSALVATMMRYSTNSDIQAHAFGALANLCLDSRGNLQELSETGGLTTMTLALQRPWKNKMDHHEAISTLSILLRSLAELGPGTNSTTVDC